MQENTGPMRILYLAFVLFFTASLSAQQEDDFALTLRYGQGATVRSLARFDLSVDAGDLGSARITDGRLGRMTGEQFGFDLRTNTNGRVLFSFAFDYFQSNIDYEFQYAELLGADGERRPLTGFHYYESRNLTLGLHYRITPVYRRLDVQLGGNFRYTSFNHDYLSEATTGRFSFTEGRLIGERAADEGRRYGLTASARVAYPLFWRIALNAEAQLGGVAEGWSFSPVGAVLVGVQVSFGRGV